MRCSPCTRCPLTIRQQARTFGCRSPAATSGVPAAAGSPPGPGTGFVAVATPGGVRPTRSGDTAWQEWAPLGPGTAWVATVGWAGTTDPASAFQEWVSRLAEPVTEERRLSWTTPDGRALELSWDGTFLRDGRAVDLDPTGRPEHPPHLENPAVCCRFGDRLLTAQWAGERLVLDLAAGRRLDPPSAIPAALSEVAGGR